MAKKPDLVTIQISRATYVRLQEVAVPFEDTVDSLIATLLDEREREEILHNLSLGEMQAVAVAMGLGEAKVVKAVSERLKLVDLFEGCDVDELRETIEEMDADLDSARGPVGDAAMGEERKQGSFMGNLVRSDRRRGADITIPDPFAPPSLKWAKVLEAQVDGREVPKNWAGVRQALLRIAVEERGYDLHDLTEVCSINAVEYEKDDEGYSYYPQFGFSIQGQNAHDAWLTAASLGKALEVPVRVWFQWRAKADALHPGKYSSLEVDA